jgi:outer membrane protein assembly factor BamC
VNRLAPTLRQMTALVIATTLVCITSGCSSLEEDKINYKSASKQLPTLEVPPDLTQIKRDSRYQINGATSASSLATANAGTTRTANDSGTAINQVGEAKIERIGNQRVLSIALSPDAVWEPLREFWKDTGFTLNLDQPELGIMETDWAENRGKLPQDFIRNAIGKVLDALYSTGERDKFRTRVERTAKGLEITITHRGMMEVYTGPVGSSTAWTPRPADPELEIEFLRRLMLKLGGQSTNNAGAIIASGVGPDTSPSASGIASDVKVTKVNNLPAIEIKDGFDRAWRRVGVAIDRTGFTVEDRDRAQGVFFVRYAPPGTPDKEPGFFAKLFTFEKATPSLAKYRIVVTSKGDLSSVVIQSADGLPETSVNGEKIIKLLADEIK